MSWWRKLWPFSTWLDLDFKPVDPPDLLTTHETLRRRNDLLTERMRYEALGYIPAEGQTLSRVEYPQLYGLIDDFQPLTPEHIQRIYFPEHFWGFDEIKFDWPR